MSTLKISDPAALPFLLTDDLYLLKSEEFSSETAKVNQEGTNLAPAGMANASLKDNSLHSSTEPNTGIENPVEESSSTTCFDYLGENNKYILILVLEPTKKNLPPKELEVLTNILKGKKQDLNDVAVVNLHTYPGATFDEFKSFFASNSIILFGINPSDLQINGVSLNQITNFKETKVLATYSIQEMLADVNKKRSFWEEMKKL